MSRKSPRVAAGTKAASSMSDAGLQTDIPSSSKLIATAPVMPAKAPPSVSIVSSTPVSRVSTRTKKRVKLEPESSPIPRKKPRKTRGDKVNDAVNFLEENHWNSAQLFICPPMIADLTDEDSGDEESNGGGIDNMNTCQLEAGFELVISTPEDEELRLTNVIEEEIDTIIEEVAEPTEPTERSQPKRKGKAPKTPEAVARAVAERKKRAAEKVEMERQEKRNKWKESYEFENSELLSKIAEFECPTTDQDPLSLATLGPIELFELFFDEDVVTFICQQTNCYALQKGADRWNDVGIEEMRCFFGILLLSGYNQLPRMKMYWEQTQDVHNNLVSDAMRRDRFLELLRYIHFCDNASLDESTTDRCWKIRPLYNMLLSRFQKNAVLTKCFNVDESMVQYFGKSGNALKQRMPMKPIRSGYKVWSLNLDDGYMFNCEIYQGKGSQSDYQVSFGHGPGVVLGLMDDLPKGNYEVYLDNFFTSAKLLYHLGQQGIGCTGTFSRKMVQFCPFPTDKEMVKAGRGIFKSFVHADLNIQLTKWQDNKQVIIGSNFDCDTPADTCQRWSAEIKERISVPRPQSITSYNTHMGGTDNMDQAINVYRPIIRNRKWYWPLFSYILQVSTYNAWKLSRHADSSASNTFLDFIRSIVCPYLTLYKTTRKRGKTNNLYPCKGVAARVPGGSLLNNNLNTCLSFTKLFKISD